MSVCTYKIEILTVRVGTVFCLVLFFENENGISVLLNFDFMKSQNYGQICCNNMNPSRNLIYFILFGTLSIQTHIF